jgi:hypothetical protein
VLLDCVPASPGLQPKSMTQATARNIVVACKQTRAQFWVQSMMGSGSHSTIARVMCVVVNSQSRPSACSVVDSLSSLEFWEFSSVCCFMQPRHTRDTMVQCNEEATGVRQGPSSSPLRLHISGPVLTCRVTSCSGPDFGLSAPNEVGQARGQACTIA